MANIIGCDSHELDLYQRHPIISSVSARRVFAGRDAANDAACLAYIEVRTQETGPGRQRRRLGNRRNAKVWAAIMKLETNAPHSTAPPCIRGDDAGMRCADQANISPDLSSRRHEIAAGEADRLVELEPAIGPAIEVDTVVNAWKSAQRTALINLLQRSPPESLRRLATGDQDALDRISGTAPARKLRNRAEF